MFTVANMFCGYACIVYAMRGDYVTAAPFIGIAMVLDMLDGRIARLTGTNSAFGLEFDSLADVISFGVAPAILVFSWGLEPLGRLGWATGFLFVTATALRLARFNIQSAGADKRYFAGMPSPAAASVLAATVFAYPQGLRTSEQALLALAMVLVPAFLMVSRIRFRSFKTINLSRRHSYMTLIAGAAVLAAIATHPQSVLVLMSYLYLLSGPVGWLVQRLRRRTGAVEADVEGVATAKREESQDRTALSRR
jgi:CDP-diacylglycerol--serine O-phosphatidyltransferase